MTTEEIIKRFAKDNNMSLEEAAHLINTTAEGLLIKQDNIVRFK